MLDVQSYLARIAYSGPLEATAETLRALHYAHLLVVPFENLDISLKHKIVVDENAVLKKVVDGICTKGGTTGIDNRNTRSRFSRAGWKNSLRCVIFTRPLPIRPLRESESVRGRRPRAGSRSPK